MLNHARGHRLALFIAITLTSAVLNGAGPVVRIALRLVGVHAEQKLPHLSAVQVILIALAAITAYSLITGRPSMASPGSPRPNAGSFTKTWIGAAAFAGLVCVGMGILGLVAGAPGLSLGGLLTLSTVTSFGCDLLRRRGGVHRRRGRVLRPLRPDQFRRLLHPARPYRQRPPGTYPRQSRIRSGLPLRRHRRGRLVVWTRRRANTVGTCCAVALPVLGIYDSLAHHPLMKNIVTDMLPVICGFLIQVSASMLEVSAAVGEYVGIQATALLWVSITAIVVLSVLHIKNLIPDMVVLIGCALFSLAALAF